MLSDAKSVLWCVWDSESYKGCWKITGLCFNFKKHMNTLCNSSLCGFECDTPGTLTERQCQDKYMKNDLFDFCDLTAGPGSVLSLLVIISPGWSIMDLAGNEAEQCQNRGA